MTKRVVEKKTVEKKAVAKKTTKSQVEKKTPRKVVAKRQVVKKPLEAQVEASQQVKPKRLLKKKYIVFLCLYALSFILYSSVTSFAKYASVVTQNGSVSVAKWDVSLSGEENEILPTITIGDDSTYQDYDLTVTSNSEVAINYSVVISNVPSGLRVIVGEDTYGPSNNKIIIDNIGHFSALDNHSTHVHRLTFIVPIDSDAFDSQTVDMDVIFSQVEL